MVKKLKVLRMFPFSLPLLRDGPFDNHWGGGGMFFMFVTCRYGSDNE